ncbi:MAG: 1,4-alpha-glucan branching protein GlgB [Lachnospiraceae bacterium]|nr:1,4-alpha-glucan branching protein GlgB [Lachnospiraceae bacterium]
MDLELYMNWREIEGIVYADTDNPRAALGAYMTDEGELVGAFFPYSAKVTAVAGDIRTEMTRIDEAGYYAAMLPTDSLVRCHYEVENDQGVLRTYEDPYQYEVPDYSEEYKKFAAGTNYEIYRYLGAHPMEIDGVSGTFFAVWAPEAPRVSVVGDFNMWDGRTHIMQKNYEYGIFELFIPGVGPGSLYKYEISRRQSNVCLKADPYGFASELRPNTASIVADIDHFTWQDDAWMKERDGKTYMKEPMAIYEMHLGSFVKPEMPEGLSEEEQKAFVPFYNYRELAPQVAAYVKEMGYTHIELMPVMEHPFDGSWGYQVTGYYAPTSRYGSPEDFMYFMNYMHEQGIGVILDWVPAHFPRDAFGLAEFDGTCLYEHKDPRQGAHPHWGTLIYNYGRPQVKNFLIANALFWVEHYHADGIRMDAVASMLYLDYGKNPGEWVANIYGGKENLDAIEFLKHLNSVCHKRNPGALLIAEESTAWPLITGDVEENGLGFDFKWNMGWMNDFTHYMQTDPYFRKNNYGGLTFSMIYAYSENFILVLSHDEVVHGKASMIYKMPGETVETKMNNLRAAYGFMVCHPGKKLLFMGQEFAQYREWSEERSLDWDLLEAHVPDESPESESAAEAEDAAVAESPAETGNPVIAESAAEAEDVIAAEKPAEAEDAATAEISPDGDETAGKSGNAAKELPETPNKKMQNYVKELLALYRAYPALSKLDTDPDGFEWINCISANESIVVFLRKTEKPEETLLVACNFDTVPQEKHRIGVPFYGKYKEILNSDDVKFGGTGLTNPRKITSRRLACDERDFSVAINIPALGIAIFTATPEEEPAPKKRVSRARKPRGAAKKTEK